MIRLSSNMPERVQLLEPTREHLPQYVRALQSGWSPENAGGAKTAQRELEQIEANAQACR